jgi:NTP pyrophosphatase (non-canonical NTP hydrolase)
MESGEIETNERRFPETLEEACELRDASATSEERDYYQEHVYRLRGQEYRSHGIRTEESAWGAVESEIGDLVFDHLVEAHPSVTAGAPDRLRDAGRLPFTVPIALEHAGDLA